MLPILPEEVQPLKAILVSRDEAAQTGRFRYILARGVKEGLVAQARGEEFSGLRYATEGRFELTPLPCWAHLSEEDYRQQVAELVPEIESTVAAELAQSGRVSIAVGGVLRQSYETRLPWEKRPPAPLYHAAPRAVRKAFWEAYSMFVPTFRQPPSN